MKMIWNVAVAALAAVATASAGTGQHHDAPPPKPMASAAEPEPEHRADPDGHGDMPHVDWAYTGPNGARHWAKLSKDFAACSGQQESPVDLRSAMAADLGTLAIKWTPFMMAATNNGHTVQFDAPTGNGFDLQGRHYSFVQFHMHDPSEHLIEGRRYPLELHFVHKLANGGLGVIGVLVTDGPRNPMLQRVLDNIPADTDGKRAGPMVDPNALLPVDRSFFMYEGSLTTPPCTETVDWIVMRTPITASLEQIEQFREHFPYNARPIQPLNRRFLLVSRR